MNTALITAMRQAHRIIGPDTGHGADRAIRGTPLPVEPGTIIALEAAADRLCSADMGTDPSWGDRTPAERWQYRDNYRAARADDPAQVADYRARRAAGCCGSVDLLIGDHLFGFNHGH